MVDQKFIIEEDRITVMLVTSVRIYLPNNLRTGKRTDLNHESTLTTICSLLKTSEVAIRLNVSENNFSSIEDILSLLVF